MTRVQALRDLVKEAIDDRKYSAREISCRSTSEEDKDRILGGIDDRIELLSSLLEVEESIEEMISRATSS